jgi:hypothetical protein
MKKSSLALFVVFLVLTIILALFYMVFFVGALFGEDGSFSLPSFMCVIASYCSVSLFIKTMQYKTMATTQNILENRDSNNSNKAKK